jgi:hypothetical protein
MRRRESVAVSDRCPNCGGSLIGDGYTAVIHCENATDVDAIAEAEADAGPIYCEAPQPLPACTLEAELATARAEVVRLREALREYGEHTGMCEWWEYGADDRHCTCGYAALCGSKAKVTP